MTEQGIATGSVKLNDVKDAITCGICLQIYNDPRYLRCDHTFCLNCLVEYQTSSTWKECPVCRKDCIPTKADLEKLPVNQLAKNLVSLVKNYEPDAVEPAAEWKSPPTQKEPPKPSGSATTNGSSTISALTSRGSDSNLSGRPQHSLEQLGDLQQMLGNHSAALRFLAQRSTEDDGDLELAIAQSLSEMGGTEGDDSGPVSASSSTSEASAVELDSGEPHPGVNCSKCQKPIRGDRYKCGRCEDFDLCRSCFKQPRGMVHETEHLFVKLKKPVSKTPPPRAVLHEDSLVMGMSMDDQSREHKIAHGAGVITYRCHNCGASPIVGVRYKCGNCQSYDLCEDCEKKSQDIHNPNHVFIIIPHPAGLHTHKPQLQFNFY